MTARSAFESLANEALKRQDYWLAESLLKEYLVAGPRCVPFLEMLAHVYEEKGDPMAAVAEYGKAIEILIEDVDPDRPDRPAELYAKIRELAPASPVAFRLSAMFDAATGKIRSSPPLEAPTESVPPAVPQLEVEACDGTTGEQNEQSMPWEKAESPTSLAPPAVLEEAGCAAEVPASEFQNHRSVVKPSVAGAEPQRHAVTGESESTQAAGSWIMEVLSPSAEQAPEQASQPASSVDTTLPSPAVDAQALPALGLTIVDESRAEETFPLEKVVEGNDAGFAESRASEGVREESLFEAVSGMVSTVEPPTTVQESESELRFVSESSVIQAPFPAPMPWEQVEEAEIHILPPEPQPTPPLAVESETRSLPEGFPAEATSAILTEPKATASVASDQTIEQRGDSSPETAETVIAPPKPEEPQLSIAAELRSSAPSWEEILEQLGLSSRKSTPSATPQEAEQGQSHEAPISPALIFEAELASPTTEEPVAGDETVHTIAEPATPFPATPSPDLEVANGEAGVLPTPMPWEQVLEVSVPIPPPEPELTETHTVEPEEAIVSSLECVDMPSPAESVSVNRTITESPVPEIPPSPVEPVQAEVELAVEASPVQPEQEFRLAVASEQPLETGPSGEVSSTGSEPVTSTESKDVREPVLDQQDAGATLAPPFPVPPTIVQEPMFEELRPVLPTLASAAHEETAPETEKAVLAEVETAATLPTVEPAVPEVDICDLRPQPEREPLDPIAPLAPYAPLQDVVERIEPPVVSGPAPLNNTEPDCEEIISQASEDPITLKLHPPEAASVKEEHQAEDPPWLRIPDPEPEPEVVTPELSTVPAQAPMPEIQASVSEPIAASIAPSTATMTSAVETLFEQTEKLSQISVHDTPATPKLAKRRTCSLAYVRTGLVLFVRNCMSTTRSLVIALLSLVGLGVATAITCVGVLGLLWVVMEERPNNAYHNLTTLPQRIISDPKKNGYIMLLGIDAAPTRDPLQVGYERKFEEMDRDTMRACLMGGDGRTTTGSASAQVLSGWLRAADPAAQFQSQAAGVQIWLAQSDVMLGRYRQWLKMPFDDWGHGRPIVPNCRQIVAVHRLYLAEGFAQDLDSGMDRLEADMTAWRTALAQAKTLAVKMMAIEAVNDDVALASGLLTRPDLDPKHVPRLLKLMRPLDQVEQSVRWPMRSQFVLATKTLDSDLRRDKGDERPWYVSVVAAMPLPKQRRFNAYADYYEAANKSSAEAYPTSMPKLSTYIRTPVTSWLDYLLNPIEHVVGIEPLPRWGDYSSRVLEADVRLRLVSLQAWVRKGPSEEGLATRIAKAGQNFYDPFTGLPMLINSKKGLIYSVGRDGKDQEGDPKFDIAVSILPSSTTTAGSDIKHNVLAEAK